uniref:Phlebovirus glycoprotein G2 fusion domain-containing protein n=1 Tax=Acrobeloides nanus TaxID=290746 RepID=A0A914D2M9_9BILA
MTQIILPENLFGVLFISNRTYTAILNENAFQHSKLFFCPTEEAAEKMQCTFPQEASRCTIAENKVNCNHDFFRMKEVKEEFHLPWVAPCTIFKRSSKGTVYAEYTQETSLAIIVRVNGMQLEAIEDMVEAGFKINKIEGCAGCETGAELEFWCQTNVPRAEVHVEFEADLHVMELHHVDLKGSPNSSALRRFGRNYSWSYSWIFSYWWMPFVVSDMTTVTVFIFTLVTCPGYLCCLYRHWRPAHHLHEE